MATVPMIPQAASRRARAASSVAVNRHERRICGTLLKTPLMLQAAWARAAEVVDVRPAVGRPVAHWAVRAKLDSIVAVATVAHPRLDSGEYLALQAAAGWRSAVELIGGEAVVTPPSGGQAASAQGELFFALRRWQETSGDAGLLLQDVFVRLPGENYLAPDLAWWAAARRPALAQGALDVVPDLVVEVLSPATRANDLGAKRDVYVAAGVRELWLADPGSATVTAVRPDGRQETVGHGDRLTSPLLPGFAVDVARLFLA